jgi:hypothetical protein
MIQNGFRGAEGVLVDGKTLEVQERKMKALCIYASVVRLRDDNNYMAE